ncbi:MAG: pyruvate:ferredoxin (flavodoxin) oxidoreductase [Oscillospiraceae bacterium]|jgi:pyruvate-ferredoxin/flavodoxin oxidoreductase|nr:pyruvate:ferredoxin (flavodoxin) oxidoreductase [Oscillospiraceae bacterium]
MKNLGLNFKEELIDGNTAVALVSYAFTQVAFVYPITPATGMAECFDRFSFCGKKNIFDQPVVVIEAQSEIGAAGMLHGASTSGALATTFTCSQGLLLMLPNIYRMAAEFLPVVIHVAARSVAKHSLSIFCEHTDVYACRQTGAAIICSSNVQEASDFAVVSHLTSISCSAVFINFFDGFYTSHEISKVRTWEYKVLGSLLDEDSLKKFRNNSLNPSRKIIKGTNQNDDIFFQCCEAGNLKYNEIAKKVCSNMEKINKKLDTNYLPFNYYGNEFAEIIIIAMGSICGVIEEVVDFLNLQQKKVGYIKVNLYRPFVPEFLYKVFPKTVKIASVLDRTKEPGSVGEPLFLDVLASMNELNLKKIEIFGGRFGLGSKNTTPSDILAVFENMFSKVPKKSFVIGINDDVTNLSLTSSEIINTEPQGTFNCQFWGLGSDGSVSSVKNITKIIGEDTSFNTKVYFQYDSKKSGGLTVSHLRFGHKKIKSHYYIEKNDFLVCQHLDFLKRYDLTEKFKFNSFFLVNSSYNKTETIEKIPDRLLECLIENNVVFYSLNAEKIATDLGLGRRINTAMAAAFLKICDVLPFGKMIDSFKRAIKVFYAGKGERTINANFLAIERALLELQEISKEDLKLSLISKTKKFFKPLSYNVVDSINKNEGNKLPVSSFISFVDGSFPNGTACLSKKTPYELPFWVPKNCIQCGLCSLVCPHSVIRASLLNDCELENNFEIKTKKAIGLENLNFNISVAGNYCTGCELCTKICPGIAGKKALFMKSPMGDEQSLFDSVLDLSTKDEILKKLKPETVKGLQFKEPLLEFSDACAGCGQTAYASLATRLFGERMYIANATGCSSIWGGAVGSIPYKSSKNGFSPAWQNSLFEDNAEFGFGMVVAQKSIREQLLGLVKALMIKTKQISLRNACLDYIKTFDIGSENFKITNRLILELEKNKIIESLYLNEFYEEILGQKEYLSKKSIWAFGGDGWAYDIGFSGIDHVMSLNEDINILVFDNELYSNTGGQASKATSKGARAAFALGGKKAKKKNLASMMMNYDNVYIASVCLEANTQQCVSAFVEAENFSGPSLIIAYAPCVEHGIKKGISNSIEQSRNAVKCGYWPLFRFNSELEKKLKIDSSIIDSDSDAFFKNERRFLNKEL